jgi:hypothetical protein
MIRHAFSGGMKGGVGFLLVGVLVGLGVLGLREGMPAALTPSPAHAGAPPPEPFIAFVGPLPFARGLLTMEVLRAEGVALFSGWVPLRLAAMGRPLDGVIVDGEALRWMRPEDQKWLQAQFREGVVIVVLGVDQDEVAPVLGLSRLRLPEEGVIPMGSLEYVMVYEVMEGDPRDIAIVREAGRFWESREFQAPAGIARPLYQGGGKAIGRLDSEGELRLLFHRLQMAIQGVYEIRAQYQEALRTFEGR